MSIISRKGKHTASRSDARKNKKQKKKKSLLNRVVAITVTIAIIMGLYCLAVFSDIPFIKKWRTIYIGTAMSTMSHQWLATAFIPQSVIDEVLTVRYQISEEQYDVTSSWDTVEQEETGLDVQTGRLNISNVEDVSSERDANAASQSDLENKAAFLELFYELDVDTLDDYIDDNPELITNGWSKLKINEAGLEQEGTDIYTTLGEQVLAIDAENGILILREKSDTYRGVLAIVKDPSMLSVYNATSLGEIGQFAHDIAQRTDSLIVMGANGFEDEGGVGNGGTLYGLSIASGVEAGAKGSGNFKRAEIRSDDRMYIVSSFYDVDPDTTDAVEFYPALVVDGVNLVDDSYEVWGTQPRAMLAQSSKEEFLLMVIEGRQGINNIGISLQDATEILVNHDAYQALNLDGGSTAIMCYEGEPITMCSNGYVYGRTLPNAVIVQGK